MKKHLKSYIEFIDENLTTAGRQMASMTMGDPHQTRQMAQRSGIDAKPFRIMMKWLANIEAKLAKSGSLAPRPAGDEDENFHDQAVQVLQSALHQAAGGKRQWMAQQQVRNAKKSSNRAGAPTNPNPAPQQQGAPPMAGQGPTAQGQGPTPLNAIR